MMKSNPNKITFTMKGNILYVPEVTLSVKDNQKLSKVFSKRCERLVYWYEYKAKKENKNVTNEYMYFLESNFFGVKRCLFWFIQTKIIVRKKLMPKSIIYQNVSLRTVRLSMEKTSMTNPLIMILKNIKK